MSTMLAEFALTSLVLIALPGPDQALIMRNALVGGRTAGVRTMLGGVSGLTVHASAAALGVSALLATSATAYAALKLVGVAYLLYLAVRMLLSSRRPGGGAPPPAAAGRGCPGAAPRPAVPAGLRVERAEPEVRVVLPHVRAAVPARPRFDATGCAAAVGDLRRGVCRLVQRHGRGRRARERRAAPPAGEGVDRAGHRRRAAGVRCPARGRRALERQVEYRALERVDELVAERADRLGHQLLRARAV